MLEVVKVHHRLSGTPAEAGVRGGFGGHTTELCVVSVEPPPKQGCEDTWWCHRWHRRRVSVEPPPKQGCEESWKYRQFDDARLSGTPAEAGVRVELTVAKDVNAPGLSGTPAEAGVRGDPGRRGNAAVSSQWNPRRSRGASWRRRVALHSP